MKNLFPQKMPNSKIDHDVAAAFSKVTKPGFKVCIPVEERGRKRDFTGRIIRRIDFLKELLHVAVLDNIEREVCGVDCKRECLVDFLLLGRRHDLDGSGIRILSRIAT